MKYVIEYVGLVLALCVLAQTLASEWNRSISKQEVPCNSERRKAETAYGRTRLMSWVTGIALVVIILLDIYVGGS